MDFFCDQQKLFLRQCQRPHRHSQIKPDIQLRQNIRRTPHQFFPVISQADAALRYDIVHHQILIDRKIREKRRIDLLMHRSDAKPVRLRRCVQETPYLITIYFTAVIRTHTGKYFHKG